MIERSRTLGALVHVAAIRSTGLSASLAIGEHVVGMLADAGTIEPGPVRSLPAPTPVPTTGTWWERAALYSTASSTPVTGAP